MKGACVDTYYPTCYNCKMNENLLANIEIVTLQPSEWRAYRDLRLMALQKEPQAFLTKYADANNDTDQEWESRLQSVTDGTSWIYFARAEDQLVGMIGAYQSEQDEINHSAEVIAVFVKPEWRGKKIARKLTERLLARLQEYGIKRAHLSVSAEQPSAVVLYQKLGFEESHRLRMVLGDGKEHEIIEMFVNLNC